MDIKTLEAAMHAFVESKGWYTPESPKPQTPKKSGNLACVGGGEVLEHFQWREQSRQPEELAGELADVMLYLLQLASITEIDLGQAVMDKLAKNAGRTWEE